MRRLGKGNTLIRSEMGKAARYINFLNTTHLAEEKSVKNKGGEKCGKL